MEVSEIPKSEVRELLLEMKSLTRIMKRRSCTVKPRFPYACKNGAMCPFHKCGTCWFFHESDGILNEMPSDAQSERGINSGKVSPDLALDQKKVSLVEHDALTAGLQKVVNDVEKKITELSKYVDSRLGECQSRLDALAEVTFQNESDLNEVLAKSAELANKSDICAPIDLVVSKVDGKIDEKFPIVAVEAQIDEKFVVFERTSDVKLEGFMKESVQDAFQAAFESFAGTMGAKVQELEDEIACLKEKKSKNG